MTPGLWNVDIYTLASPGGRRGRTIGGGPLINLDALQAAIARGRLRSDDLWPATQRSRNSLEIYRWTHDFVLQLLGSLRSGDYKKSEWCDIDGGRKVPADVYTICYDEIRQERNPRGIGIYLKFSIDENEAITIVLVQNHF